MNELSKSAPRGSSMLTVLGVIAIIMGILSMLAPAWTGLSFAVAVGVLVLVGGITRSIWAFRASSLGRGILSLTLGALTVVCGLMLVTDPILASGFLTLMLAGYLLVDGAAEIAAGTQRREEPGSGWLILGGILSILLGTMLWAQFPLSGAWAVGILLGIKLFSVGLIMVTGGTMVRSIAEVGGSSAMR